uniref:Uncharacterized protein n=1 Tax=Oryza sativa subsp. japonica TaxID=39947 RepID=Q8H4C3_ORYSJ|nr:hypothetical protein [Oryza sativa Japonica Group]BAD31308.1 hypothetical protein [Oryza sativa Japonica Group]
MEMRRRIFRPPHAAPLQPPADCRPSPAGPLPLSSAHRTPHAGPLRLPAAPLLPPAARRFSHAGVIEGEISREGEVEEVGPTDMWALFLFLPICGSHIFCLIFLFSFLLLLFFYLIAT